MNNNNKFESIYQGEYVELFFLKEEFFPDKEKYSLRKQRAINFASGVENYLANNISISKIEEESELITTVSNPNYYLSLDLFSFKNLRTCKLSKTFFKLKSLPGTLANLVFWVDKWDKEAQSDFSIFSGFKNLERLDLGNLNRYSPDYPPAWKGSLESLKDCTNLKFLCIGHITDITGLEHLPLDNLKTVNLFGTPFDNLLFGDKTLDPNKLTIYSENLPKQEVIDAIREYQKNYKNKETFQSRESEQKIQIIKDLQEKDVELTNLRETPKTKINRPQSEIDSIHSELDTIIDTLTEEKDITLKNSIEEKDTKSTSLIDPIDLIEKQAEIIKSARVRALELQNQFSELRTIIDAPSHYQEIPPHYQEIINNLKAESQSLKETNSEQEKIFTMTKQYYKSKLKEITGERDLLKIQINDLKKNKYLVSWFFILAVVLIWWFTTRILFIKTKKNNDN